MNADDLDSSEGAPRPLSESLAAVYEVLRKVARRVVDERGGRRVLDPTELVHECYIKLMHDARASTLPRPKLLALAATAIRTLLVDHARELSALKRGGGLNRVTLQFEELEQAPGVDLLALDSALERLAELDPDLARVVELRFFAGLSNADVAAAMERSPREIDREWAAARAWLHRELS